MKKALTQLIRDKTSCEKPLVNEKTAEIKIKNIIDISNIKCDSNYFP